MSSVPLDTILRLLEPGAEMPPEPEGSTLRPEEAQVLVQAQELALARVEFAEAFIRAKTAWRGPKPMTDREAHEMTIAATKDEVTIAQARYEVSLNMMRQS